MIHQLPLLTERQYIATIHSRLSRLTALKLPGLQATVRLAWALALRGISQLPDVTGKPLVGHFLMRNACICIYYFRKGVTFHVSKHEPREILRIVVNESFLFFLSLKRNYSKFFFPFLVASDNSL